MGPRPFSRGNVPQQNHIELGGSGLQWGHGLSAVETPCRLSVRDTTDWASMGPRPFSRGNRSLSRTRPFCRLRLQWGHGLSAVETLADRANVHGGRGGFNGATAFQPWKPGHPSACPPRKLRGFNGATAFQPWKRVSEFFA